MKLLILFLSLFAFTSISDARLGETPSQVMMNHSDFKLTGRGKISDRAYILIFRGKSEEVALIFLDDKCAEEIISRDNNERPNFAQIVDYMETYDPAWYAINHPNPKIKAVASASGKYYALYGPIGYVTGYNASNTQAFRIMTREWQQYCKSNKIDIADATWMKI